MTPNWLPNTLTGTLGSIFVPDNSAHENNDATKPATGGGHNWAFDQGATLCKMIDKGTATATTGWTVPPTTSTTDCITLPIINAGAIANGGDVPGQGDVITPTCDPTKLSTGVNHAANTYFNQLGCSISHGAATTLATATSFMFLAGTKGGLFVVPLANAAPKLGGDAGKVATPITAANLKDHYFSAIPTGQKLTNASISLDGQLAIATSDARSTTVFGCLNPLGDPGDITKPINPAFTVASAGTVKCMAVGGNGLQKDLTTQFGPDNQPYFGGQRTFTSYGNLPGGTAKTAWPECIWQNNGSTSLADAFAHNRSNGCGNAVANFSFSAALLIQPSIAVRHGQYLYTGLQTGGPITQFKITVNPISGLSSYTFRTYLSGVGVTTGIGVADDLKSLMVYSDPSAAGVAGAEIVTKLPLCEDM
ncbi:MAG TPA: hypothetical protein VFL55_08280 [Acetobacteraceae bacterium]|nr:hypothetical protein [Acetobacteraceae bacterium]